MSEASSSQPHPDLEGYVSKRKSGQLPSWIPEKWRRMIPTSQEDLMRAKVNMKLWAYFTGRIRLQRVVGMSAVGISSYLFICWLDGVAPYFAISEDPNTAFKHPHWQQVANDRAKRERELAQRVQSSGPPSSSLALESATKSYASQNANDRL